MLLAGVEKTKRKMRLKSPALAVGLSDVFREKDGRRVSVVSPKVLRLLVELSINVFVSITLS